jgi:hypothetical protein
MIVREVDKQADKSGPRLGVGNTETLPENKVHNLIVHNTRSPSIAGLHVPHQTWTYICLSRSSISLECANWTCNAVAVVCSSLVSGAEIRYRTPYGPVRSAASTQPSTPPQAKNLISSIRCSSLTHIISACTTLERASSDAQTSSAASPPAFPLFQEWVHGLLTTPRPVCDSSIVA